MCTPFYRGLRIGDVATAGRGWVAFHGGYGGAVQVGAEVFVRGAGEVGPEVFAGGAGGEVGAEQALDRLGAVFGGGSRLFLHPDFTVDPSRLHQEGDYYLSRRP